MYTSGSTGDPKGVKHVQTTPAAAAALMGRNIIGIREDDVVFSAAKLFFSYGMGNALAFPMSVGGIDVLWPHRPTPDAVFDIMRQHQPTRVLRRADALRLDAGAQGDGARRRLRSAAALRLGRRSAADGARRALARGRGLRRGRRHRLDRDVPDVLSATGRRRALRLDRQAGAGLRAAHRRRERPRRRRRRDRRIAGARPDRRRRLLEPARQEPPHLRGRMDALRRQVLSRRRRLLLLLRAHRRHVQGLRHVGVAVRGRGRADVARSGVRGRRHRQGRRRRPDQAEGLHRAARTATPPTTACSRTCACTSRSAPARGNSRAGSTCAPTCRAPPPARSSASSCATWMRSTRDRFHLPPTVRRSSGVTAIPPASCSTAASSSSSTAAPG